MCKINKIVIDINNYINYLNKVARIDMFTIKIITYFTELLTSEWHIFFHILYQIKQI